MLFCIAMAQIKSAKEGDFGLVERILKMGVDVDTLDPEKVSTT